MAALANEMEGAFEKPASNKRYFVLIMLMIGTTVNYLDRTNFGIAAPVLMKEFGIDTGTMGLMMSAFFWSYMVSTPLSGILVSKIGPRYVLGWSGILWGFATAICAACGNITQFFGARILLGFTEAPAYPCNAHVVSLWVPVRERAFSSACFNASSKIGSAFAPPLVAWIVFTYGWRMSFIVTGAIASIWGIAWLFTYKDPDKHPTITKSELAYIRKDEVLHEDGTVKTNKIPTLDFFKHRRFVICCLGYFGVFFYFAVMMFWVPTYLTKVWGLSLMKMGLFASFPWIVGTVAELCGGKLSDWWYRSGTHLNTVRRTGLGICMIGSAVGLAMIQFSGSPVQAITLLCVSIGLFSLGAGMALFAHMIDIAPYGQAATVLGLIGMFGNFGALLGPIVVGYLAKSQYGFNGAFTVTAAVAVCAGLLYVFNSYERIEPITKS